MHTLLQRNTALTSAEIDGDVVLMCPESGKYYSLAGPARRIWELLAEPTTPDSLYSTLLHEYAVPTETCRNDTDGFLKEMQERKLVCVVNEK